MKVLVATRERQGDDIYDFCWAQEGELVYPQQTCPDVFCACGRAFAGLLTERHTTTAMVVDRPDLTRRGCIALAQAQLDTHDHPHAPGLAADCIDRMLSVASRLRVGDVVERVGTTYRPRPVVTRALSDVSRPVR